MTKTELMKSVGDYVELTLFDGTKLKGTLCYTSEFCEAQGYYKPNYFHIAEHCFRVSHVKKLHLRRHDTIEYKERSKG